MINAKQRRRKDSSIRNLHNARLTSRGKAHESLESWKSDVWDRDHHCYLKALVVLSFPMGKGTFRAMLVGPSHQATESRLLRKVHTLFPFRTVAPLPITRMSKKIIDTMYTVRVLPSGSAVSLIRMLRAAVDRGQHD